MALRGGCRPTRWTWPPTSWRRPRPGRGRGRGGGRGRIQDHGRGHLRPASGPLTAAVADRRDPRRPGGGSALIWRIHHALADGMTAMRMASAVLWDEAPVTGPEAPATGPRTTRTRSRAPRAARAARPVPHHRLATLLAAAREVPQPWLRSPFDGHIDARREVAFTSAGIEELHRVAAAADGATLNDAVLTVVAGGLRRWLEAHHGHLGAVRVKVPVSLHALPPPEPPEPRPGPPAPGPAAARWRPGPAGQPRFVLLPRPAARLSRPARTPRGHPPHHPGPQTGPRRPAR